MWSPERQAREDVILYRNEVDDEHEPWEARPRTPGYTLANRLAPVGSMLWFGGSTRDSLL